MYYCYRYYLSFTSKYIKLKIILLTTNIKNGDKKMSRHWFNIKILFTILKLNGRNVDNWFCKSEMYKIY